MHGDGSGSCNACALLLLIPLQARVSPGEGLGELIGDGEPEVDAAALWKLVLSGPPVEMPAVGDAGTEDAVTWVLPPMAFVLCSLIRLTMKGSLWHQRGATQGIVPIFRSMLLSLSMYRVSETLQSYCAECPPLCHVSAVLLQGVRRMQACLPMYRAKTPPMLSTLPDGRQGICSTTPKN